MSKTNLPNIDLNLLVILDAVFNERSLTLAGKKLFMTQSAVSHALSKLRDHFEDHLFIRRGNSMEPTALCKMLHENISPSLKNILQSLEDRGEFNPATSKRMFCFGLSDYLCKLLLPEILIKLKKQAPGVSIRIVQPTYEQRTTMLKEGKLDVFLGCSRDSGAGVHKEKLFEDREVCIVRKDHPVKGPVMTEDELANSEFAALSLSESGLGFLEDFLYRKGVQRKIKVVVQQEIVIPSLVENSDLVGTLAERLAKMYTEDNTLRIVELPLKNTMFEVCLHWHNINDQDPAQQWIRSIIRETTDNLPRFNS
ncbi:LysR family transcriptional regulator [Maridesulfovibrio hydrothermalis]|uniref:Transcriptional regulator, LysR family n=1 Tax=Maridesulfovibrio hydrothermalis AM13 = DSM 14728 TaxID=1121451 RepID=L0RE90_9BACT|nr:LysR family transcriptional regulator [Maridesulfovibrio hydrothermalis]CCO25074.1 Transcriptional regulator, LysR family [Maridesulfovibrio hydrothermalis AM13 = DSM 14728]